MKIWSELGQRLCIEGWHIDGIPDLSSGQEVPDLLSDLDSDVFLSFSGRGPEVRGKCDVLLAGEEANHLGPVNTGHATFRLKMYFSQVNNVFFDHTEISLLMLDIHFSVQTLFLE